MSRIPTPATIDAAPTASRPLLEGVKKQLGVVPNLFRLISNSPAALEGYLGAVWRAEQGRVAGPDARAYRAGGRGGQRLQLLPVGPHLSRQKPREARRCRDHRQPQRRFKRPKADAAVRFATKLVRERGHVSEDDVRAVKAAGYDDGQVIEIVLHVALNTWTNYINEVAKTEIDFPVVTARKFN